MSDHASIGGLARCLLLSITLALGATSGAARAADDPPIVAASLDAFWDGDFAELERQNAIFRLPGHIGPDGISQITLFRKGLDKVFRNSVENPEAYFKELDLLTLQWATEHPESAFAHALHARSLVAHAWSYRGGGYANTVPPEAWKDFHAYMKRAVDYLQAHAEVALQDSYAHDVLLDAARGLDLSHQQRLAIANDGMKRNPEDTNLYLEVLAGVLPKWGGNPRAVDDFIKYAAAQTQERFGQGMYTRLYLSAASDQFGHALFEDSFADWDKMKQGFEDLLARFPDNTSRLNGYAYVACLAKDRDTFLKQFARIEKSIVKEQWGRNPERTLEGCRRWATSS